MCPESVAKEIGGWSSSHDVSVQYGQGYPLQLKLEWLSKAYDWLEKCVRGTIKHPPVTLNLPNYLEN